MTRFTTDIQMRFRDIDGMGHVNNAVYLSYIELARTQFYMQHANRRTLDEIDFILAHVEIDFESQATWGDQIQVAVWPSKIGNSSFTLSYEIKEKRSGRILARAKSVLVSYDYEKKKSKPISDDFRSLLQSGLEAQRSRPSGFINPAPKGSMTGRAFPAEMAKKGARPPVGTKGAADWYWKRYTELYPKYFWADDTKLADIVVASAKGSLLYDVEGKEYIDLTSQWATNNLGNVHPEILKATVDALERYGFLILFMNPHLPMIDVAERLLSIRPSDNLTRVFLELSGTGAAEGAVKHAIEASGRPLILSFMGQYHGLSIGATAFGTLASRMRRNWEAFSGGAVHAPYPMTYRKPKGMTDDQFGEWCLGFLEDQILRHVAYPDRIAGAIFEPIALEAGVWIPPKNFVRGLRKPADTHGWFIIAAEAEAGLARTGKMWGIEHFGVAPDLVSIGKALGGGLMPLGAVLGDDRSMGKDDVVAGTTFGGHPAACVAATVTIDIMRRDRIPERAARVGGKALKRVKEWEDLSIVGETRGLGLAIGVEIVGNKGTKARDNDTAREVFFDCVRGGVIPLYDYEMNVLRIQPPLTIEESLLDKALDGIESALRKHSR